MSLAQAHRLGRHFHALIIFDIGERLFQRHANRRRQAHRFVLALGTDVSELLALEHVNFKIIVARMLTNDHAAIHLPAGLDHHRATIFQLPHRVGDGLPGFIGNQHPITTTLNITLVGRVFMEQAVHDRRTARVRQQFALISDQAARGSVEYEAQTISA